MIVKIRFDDVQDHHRYEFDFWEGGTSFVQPYDPDDTIDVTRATVNIQNQEFVRMVYDKVREVEGRNLVPKWLLVGASMMDRIMNVYIDSSITLPHMIVEATDPLSGRVKLFGMTVILVPWMEGCICLPEFNYL